MNEHTISIIRDSWILISAYPDAFIKFYDKLFEISPAAKRFFPEDDLSRQGEKLSYTIGFAVENLDRLNEIKESIEDLGRMHNELNIGAQYYEHVKEALIFTIKEAMGDSYKEEVGTSWDQALTYISNVMINAPAKKRRKPQDLVRKLFKSR